VITVPAGRRIYGIQLPVQSQSKSYSAAWEQSAGVDDIAAMATTCDDNGYAYVGVCDHVALPEQSAATMGTQWVDPMSTLGWLAGLTSRIGLLTHVYVLPYRHPLVAAKQFATLDYVSKGRAICGVGAGHVQREFEALGVDFHSRGRAMNEGVPLLARALESEWVDGLGAKPRPVQTPRPPIWIAGSSPSAIARAARLGDGWLPQGPSSQDMVDSLLAQRAKAGRDGDFMVGHITPFMYVGTPGWDVGEGVFTGGADEIADKVLAGTAKGVNQLQVRFKSRSCAELCDQLAAFARDVAPLLTTI